MDLVDLPADAEIIPLGKLVDLPAGAEVRGAYSGALLPLSRDAQGNVSFDPNAGILGRLIEAIKAPGDVYSGNAPIMAGGGPNPDLINRAIDFAGFFSPVGAAARASGTVRQSVAPPTAQQLKEAGGAGYTAAREAGLEIDAPAVANLAVGLQSDLLKKGMGATVAPKTHEILNGVVASQGPNRAFVTISDLEGIRRNLSNITGESTDQNAARQAIRAIDSFFETLDPQSVVAGPATPEALQAIAGTQRAARQNYAAAMRSNDITGALDRATTGIGERALTRAQAAHSGYNIDNTIRQKLASFLEKPENVAGFSEAELRALRDALQGGVIRNAARDVGNRLGTGATSTALGLLFGSAAGHATQNPYVTAAAALAPGAAGAGLKSVANSLARRSLGAADDVIRQNSPLYREMLASQPLIAPDLDRNSAILRALLLGGPSAWTTFSPQQPPGMFGAPQQRGAFGPVI